MSNKVNKLNEGCVSTIEITIAVQIVSLYVLHIEICLDVKISEVMNLRG